VCITGDQRGVGRLGADYWRAEKDDSGKRIGYVWNRYLHSSWRNLDLWSYTLAPGPDGPVASAPLEYFREGVQLCEARIAIERALLDEKQRATLGDDLVGRCRRALAARHMAMVRSLSHWQLNDPTNRWITRWRRRAEAAGAMWFAGSGWQRRNAELFDLAGEVTRKLAAGR